VIGLLLVAILFQGGAEPVCAAGPGGDSAVVWGALVHATRPKGELEMPDALKAIAPTLCREFGYSKFAILGHQRTRLGSGDEKPWLIPGGDFSLCVDPGTADGGDPSGGRRLTLQLFQGKKLLVKTVVALGKDAPLLIRGPLSGKGQLIIVLKML
jgi:hypothetical protein